MICFNSSLDMNLKQSGGEIMKKTKKIMALVMAGLMAASMTACQTKTEPQPTGGQESESASAEAPAGTEAPAAAGKTYKIGIIQLTQHAALDKTNEGFVAALKDAGLDCEIDQQNASGDQSACQTIGRCYRDNPDSLQRGYGSGGFRSCGEQ